MRLILAALLIAVAAPAVAHDWLTGKRNGVGDLCCGMDVDCHAQDNVRSTGWGWIVNGIEFVPYREAAPSPDGKVWICRRVDQSRRCVFGPPPNT